MKTVRSNAADVASQAGLSGWVRAVIFALFVVLCSSLAKATDPAKTITRQCPIKRMDTEQEYQLAVKEGPEWKGGKVRVIGECTYDSRAIKSWAEAQGIKCRIASTAAWVGRRKIAGGHWTVIPEGSRYTIDYVENIGIVSRRIRKEDEYVFIEKGKNDGMIVAMSQRVVTLPGTPNPVRSIDFTKF